jgi:formate hydrogenlyase subunit 6/NADH:ubiquinone oxidoreductase subunit I
MRGFPKFNPRRCTGCEVCSNMCPTKAIEIIDNYTQKTRKVKLWFGACIFCGNCRDFCPDEVIELTDKPIPPSPNKWIFEELEIELAACENCGKNYYPAALYEKVNRSIIKNYKNYKLREKFKKVCSKCKLLHYAKIFTKTLS